MTMQEQLDKFADDTRFSVSILCSIAKRQGKEEMQNLVSVAISEIEAEKQGADGIVKFGMNKALEIIRKHTGIGGDTE